MEFAIQTLVGFVLGLLLTILAVFLLSRTTVSIAIPWELSPYPHFLLANPDDANVVQTHFLPIKFEPLYAAVTFLAVLLIGLMTSLFSTWQISKLKPVEILRNE